MTVWHCSDLHLNHTFVAGLRGMTVDEHNSLICQRWADVVRKDDIVYVEGDVALGDRRAAMEALSALPGRKRLIAGNHDTCHPFYRDAAKKEEIYRIAFEWIAPFARRRIAGHEVLLSHFPYHADHSTGFSRYMQYRLPDRGMWLLHGHLHSPRIWTSDHEIHVGWDAWGRLVSESEIATLIEEGEGA